MKNVFALAALTLALSLSACTKKEEAPANSETPAEMAAPPADGAAPADAPATEEKAAH
jgi:hypothetical protein